MILNNVTSQQEAEIKAILDKYTNGTTSDKAIAITELVAYVNRKQLGIDIVCPYCPRAKDLMQYALQRFNVAPKPATKKKKSEPQPLQDPQQDDAIIE